MSKRFTLIYLSLAPILFGLSWFISHRLHVRFMQLANNNMQARNDDRSLIYALLFVSLYLGAYVVIRDLYKDKV